MQDEGPNVPQLRFNGFKAEWQRRELGEITSKIGSGKTPKGGRSVYLSDGIPLLRSQNIVNDSIDHDGLVFISEEIDEEMGNSRVRSNDVLLNITGASIGRSAVYRRSEPANVNQHVCIIRPDRDHNPDFIQLNLSAPWGQNAIDRSQAGGAREGLNFQQIGKMCFDFPCVAEQAQIGSYFKSLDRMIGLHQRKHDKLVTLKQAMLQKMFPQDGATTPEIRFKGFEGEWGESELQNEVEFFSGLTYSPHHVREEGGTLVLRSSNVQNGRLVDADNVYVESSIVNCEQVRVGDIVVVVRNGSRSLIGKHAPVVEEMNDTVIGAFMTGIRSTQPGFINALLDTAAFVQQINENTGATINQITTGVFKKMRFRFPESQEREQIGNYFRNIDTLISNHAKQLEKLKNIKSACLEKMFV